MYPHPREDPLFALVLIGQTYVVPALKPLAAIVLGVWVVRPIFIAWAGRQTAVDVGLDLGFEVSLGINILLVATVVLLTTRNKQLRRSVKKPYQLTMFPPAAAHPAAAPASAQQAATRERRPGEGGASSVGRQSAGDEDAPVSDTSRGS